MWQLGSELSIISNFFKETTLVNTYLYDIIYSEKSNHLSSETNKLFCYTRKKYALYPRQKLRQHLFSPKILILYLSEAPNHFRTFDSWTLLKTFPYHRIKYLDSLFSSCLGVLLLFELDLALHCLRSRYEIERKELTVSSKNLALITNKHFHH